MRRRRSITRVSSRLVCLLALSLLVFTGGCEEYDPPPEAAMVPSTGSYKPGESVRLEFSEAIKPESLVINVWPSERDEEKEFVAGLQPLLPDCTLASCGDETTSLTIDEDNLGATLTLDPDGLGKPNVPLVLEISSTLEDSDGRKRGVSNWFDFKFSYNQCPEDAGEVEFTEGDYLLVGSTTDPLPAALRLVTHFRVLPDGFFAAAGAEANLRENATSDTPMNPDEVLIDDTEQGWTIFVTGRICVIDGLRRINSEPFIVELTVAGIDLLMEGVRFEGEVIKDEATGHDRIDALLVYEQLTLTVAGRPSLYEGSNAPIVGVYIPPEKHLEGTPEVCTSVCGAVIGKCNPPEGFPEEKYCAESEP